MQIARRKFKGLCLLAKINCSSIGISMTAKVTCDVNYLVRTRLFKDRLICMCMVFDGGGAYRHWFGGTTLIHCSLSSELISWLLSRWSPKTKNGMNEILHLMRLSHSERYIRWLSAFSLCDVRRATTLFFESRLPCGQWTFRWLLNQRCCCCCYRMPLFVRPDRLRYGRHVLA